MGPNINRLANRDAVVDMVTSRRNGRSRNHGSIPGKRIKIFLFSKANKLDLFFQPASYSLNNDYFLGRVKAAGGVKLTTHLHLFPSLSVRGTIPFLPPFACMAWTGTNLSIVNLGYLLVFLQGTYNGTRESREGIIPHSV